MIHSQVQQSGSQIELQKAEKKINHLDKKTWRIYNDDTPRKLGNIEGGVMYEQRRYFRKKQAREINICHNMYGVSRSIRCFFCDRYLFVQSRYIGWKVALS